MFKEKKSLHSISVFIFLVLVVLIAFPVKGVAQERVFKFGTSDLGGVWFSAGAVMSEIINKHVSGVQSVAVASGAVENVKAVDESRMGMGLAHSTTSYSGWGTKNLLKGGKGVKDDY